MNDAFHEPVLVKEVLELLNPRPGQMIVDMNLGHGGHTLQILSRMGEEGLLVGIDRDPWMLATARKRLEDADVPRSCYRLVQADFLQLPNVLAEVPAPALAPAEVPAPDAVLFDLGPSTPQLLDPARGMSWESDEALDMRLDPSGPEPSAAEIVNSWSEDELVRIFHGHADERWARRIARMIVQRRTTRPIRTGRELAAVVCEAIPRGAWPPKIHPATRVFLALRIEVNQEYRKIEEALPMAFDLLKPGGRMAVISFHSGEDRRVKEFMRRMTQPEPAPWPLPQSAGKPARARALTRKPVEAGEDEVRANPRSRSARLRAIEKLPNAG